MTTFAFFLVEVARASIVLLGTPVLIIKRVDEIFSEDRRRATPAEELRFFYESPISLLAVIAALVVGISLGEETIRRPSTAQEFLATFVVAFGFFGASRISYWIQRMSDEEAIEKAKQQPISSIPPPVDQRVAAWFSVFFGLGGTALLVVTVLRP